MSTLLSFKTLSSLAPSALCVTFTHPHPTSTPDAPLCSALDHAAPAPFLLAISACHKHARLSSAFPLPPLKIGHPFGAWRWCQVCFTCPLPRILSQCLHQLLQQTSPSNSFALSQKPIKQAGKALHSCVCSSVFLVLLLCTRMWLGTRVRNSDMMTTL